MLSKTTTDSLNQGDKFPRTFGNRSPMFVNIWGTGTCSHVPKISFGEREHVPLFTKKLGKQGNREHLFPCSHKIRGTRNHCSHVPIKSFGEREHVTRSHDIILGEMLANFGTREHCSHIPKYHLGNGNVFPCSPKKWEIKGTGNICSHVPIKSFGEREHVPRSHKIILGNILANFGEHARYEFGIKC